MKKITIGFIIASMSFASTAWAATLRIVPDSSAVELGQPVRVNVVLDTQGDDINALQATITFPASHFTLQSIENGSSPISFWVVPPKETASGTVTFSGVMPGGFRGTSGAVISLVLNPNVSGSGEVALVNAIALLNDGNGSPATVKLTNAAIAVSTARYSGPTATVSAIAPEPFTPAIAKDPTVYDGNYFLAFSTTDKGSGIDHYDVAEVSPGTPAAKITNWQHATSPYLLEDQTLSSDIYVRAVDHAGHSTVVKLSAPHASAMWIVIFAVIALALGLVWWLGRRRRT